MMLTLLHLAELLALICSLSSLHPRNHPATKPLLLVMVVTAVAELSGAYLRRVLEVQNHNVYNISVPLVVLILMSMYIHNLRKHQRGSNIHWVAIIYLVFVVSNLLWIQGTRRFATYNYIAGAVGLLLLVCMYFYWLIKRPEKVSLLNEPVFWLSAGIVLMYIPKSLLYSVFEYLSYSNDYRPTFAQTFTTINTVTSVTFYASICLACTCRLIFRSSTKASI